MKNSYYPILALIIFLITSNVALSQVSGTVFRDFNGDGSKGVAEPGIAGVLVKAYDTSNTQVGGTQTSSATGAYSFSGLTLPVRIEFEIPSSACNLSNTIDYSALGGASYGSSVQFVSATSNTIDFAIHNPGEYVGDLINPKVFMPCYIGGNPLGGAPESADADAFLWVGYTSTGQQTDNNHLAVGKQMGSTYGTAYSKQAKKIFTAALLRRHVGLGPLGPGGIYMIDPEVPFDGNANLNWLDFQSDLSIDTHNSGGTYNVDDFTVGTNVERGLPANPINTPSADPMAFRQAGKVAFGDIDISDDGQYLYVMNLYDRTLYKLDLQDPENPVKPTNAQVTSQVMPNPCSGINAGEPRPFAVKYYRNKVYVGITCSGQDAARNPIGDSSTMSFNVYELDGASLTPSASPIYTQDLSYRDAIFAHPSTNRLAKWLPWRDTFSGLQIEPQPLLSDIEFDNTGSMIIGALDRYGLMMGSANHSLTGTGSFSGIGVGELLKVTPDGSCNYTLVNDDFYMDNDQWGTFCPPGYCHNEMGLGGLTAMRSTTDDLVLSTMLNPIRGTSNGFFVDNNVDGSLVRAYEVIYDPDWGDGGAPNLLPGAKAQGLGDPEMEGIISPIEIGNYVWNDADSDGIQDPDETPIEGVTVELVKGGGVIATALTNASGNYYFSSGLGTDSDSEKYGIAELLPNMAYSVRIPNVQGTSKQTVLGSNSLTLANVGGAGQPDVRDSDGTLSGDDAVVTFTSGLSGQNNHSFDFGFGTVACMISATNTTPVCSNAGTPSDPSDDTYTFNITVTDGGGASTSWTASDPLSTTGSYGSTTSFGPYTISGNGSLNITITDDVTGSCQFMLPTINAPSTCSTGGSTSADLRLEKVASTTTVTSGQQFTYTLTLTNDGPDTAVGVSVIDLLPSAVTYVNHSSTTGHTNYVSGTGLWTIGDLANGANAVLTITVIVN